MNHLVDNEEDLTPRHKELTFSNGAIFAMFFGLVLSWGLFFGLGFNLGSHKSSSSDKADASDSTSGPTANFSNFKPAAGSPAGGSSSPQPAPANTESLTAPVVPPAHGASSSEPEGQPPAPIVHAQETSNPAHETPAAAPAPPTSSSGTASGSTATGSFVVQVAAVSHQEDADLLMSALKGKGYAVIAHSEPQDKLVHIQVGPFSTKVAAEAMRQRLLGDGYNAFIK